MWIQVLVMWKIMGENENSQVLKDQLKQFTRVVVLDDTENCNAFNAKDGVHFFPFALCF